MRRVSPAVFVAVVLPLSACQCEEPPCEVAFDCAAGQQCVDGACVSGVEGEGEGNPGGEGEGEGGEGEGEGEGDGAFTVIINQDVEAPISMFLPGAVMGLAGNVAVVGEYQAGGGVDQLRVFDLGANEFVEGDDDLDFNDNSVGDTGAGCKVDSVSLERGTDPQDNADELWFSCAVTGLEQALVDDLQDQVDVIASDGADLLVRIVTEDAVNGDIAQRRVYARRGDGAVKVQQVTTGVNDRGAARPQDTVAVDFGEVAGLFLVAETDLDTFGDIVLVFDRAYPGLAGKPALVPIERAFPGASETTTWLPAHDPWRPLQLPDDTHAVRVGDVDDPANLTTDNQQSDQQNLEVYVPSTGDVYFERIEDAMNDVTRVVGPGSGNFATLHFDDLVPDAPPASSERILLTDVPGVAGSVFYVVRGEDRAYGWKLRLHQTSNDDFTNDVEGAVFNDEDDDEPNGLVAIDGRDDAAWISLSSRDELHRILFSDNF